MTSILVVIIIILFSLEKTIIKLFYLVLFLIYNVIHYILFLYFIGLL